MNIRNLISLYNTITRTFNLLDIDFISFHTHTIRHLNLLRIGSPCLNIRYLLLTPIFRYLNPLLRGEIHYLSANTISLGEQEKKDNTEPLYTHRGDLRTEGPYKGCVTSKCPPCKPNTNEYSILNTVEIQGETLEKFQIENTIEIQGETLKKFQIENITEIQGETLKKFQIEKWEKSLNKKSLSMSCYLLNSSYRAINSLFLIKKYTTYNSTSQKYPEKVCTLPKNPYIVNKENPPNKEKIYSFINDFSYILVSIKIKMTEIYIGGWKQRKLTPIEINNYFSYILVRNKIEMNDFDTNNQYKSTPKCNHVKKSSS